EVGGAAPGAAAPGGGRRKLGPRGQESLIAAPHERNSRQGHQGTAAGSLSPRQPDAELDIGSRTSKIRDMQPDALVASFKAHGSFAAQPVVDPTSEIGAADGTVASEDRVAGGYKRLDAAGRGAVAEVVGRVHRAHARAVSGGRP